MNLIRNKKYDIQYKCQALCKCTHIRSCYECDLFLQTHNQYCDIRKFKENSNEEVNSLVCVVVWLSKKSETIKWLKISKHLVCL